MALEGFENWWKTEGYKVALYHEARPVWLACLKWNLENPPMYDDGWNEKILEELGDL